MKVDIVGGGPGGLYLALLLKKQDPSHEIDVHEQNPEGATYGWGVVFSDVALKFLEDADPEFYREFTANHTRCDFMEIIKDGVRVQVHNNHFSRVARIELLHVLNAAATRAGVNVHHDTRIEDVEALAQETDLLVGADGANSTVRDTFAPHFEPQFEHRRNKFAWYGTHQLFHPVSLVFRQTEHGPFIAHSYQYSDDLSTFLVEVSPETWHASGLDRMDEDQSRAFCAEVFRPELGSNELLTNRSLWFEATVLRNQHWWHRNVVLLGDALRTVHFSLGSGTRMAMQDAIALSDALSVSPQDLPAAFAAYEQARRRSSTAFQVSADRSLDWYENVDAKMQLDPVTFAYDYMLRTGRVDHEDLRERDPIFVQRYEAMQSALAAS